MIVNSSSSSSNTFNLLFSHTNARVISGNGTKQRHPVFVYASLLAAKFSAGFISQKLPKPVCPELFPVRQRNFPDSSRDFTSSKDRMAVCDNAMLHMQTIWKGWKKLKTDSLKRHSGKKNKKRLRALCLKAVIMSTFH